MLRTPQPHISSSEAVLPRLIVAPLPNSEQINHPSSNHTYTKSTSNHIHNHYSPSVTLRHTTHISSTAPTYGPHCHPWICGPDPARVTALVARWSPQNQRFQYFRGCAEKWGMTIRSSYGGVLARFRYWDDQWRPESDMPWLRGPWCIRSL